MKPASVRVSRVIGVPAARAYAVLSDYRQHHPKILPQPTFGALDVEEGGVGAGTRIRVTMRVMGRPRVLRMLVGEPEPGRVLVEEDVDTGDVTTFTVRPRGDAACEVEIATTWKAKPGVAGWLERMFNPRVAGPLYEKELENLEAYARSLVNARAPPS